MSARLTDEELANVLRWCAPDSEHDYVRDMATELRERRAADLSAEQIDELCKLRQWLSDSDRPDWLPLRALSVLDRIINGGGR